MSARTISLPPFGRGLAPELREASAEPAIAERSPAPIPAYLAACYWWAYVHPNAVKFFERQWLINLILWGHYGLLRDAALDALRSSLAGNTLQVGCAYGDLTPRLNDQVTRAGGRLDVVDVLPVQLRNLAGKLPQEAPVRLLAMDAMRLELPDEVYDQVLVFFLLHEQPRAWRERTLREILRVLKPGGRVVIMDYARPRWWHPLRYLWPLVLGSLEPFALDLWRDDLSAWLPKGIEYTTQRWSFFAGLYQQLVLTKRDPMRSGTALREHI